MTPRSLILFDIDGTLIAAKGLGRASLERAFHELYGAEGVFEGMRFHGRIDPDIVGEGLQRIGRDPAEWRVALDRYLELLEAEAQTLAPLALPGVPALMHRLVQECPDIALGIVTGNVERGAQIKLAVDGLATHFPLGAYGGERPVRAELIALAVERTRVATGAALPLERVAYIGDTEFDVRAARSAGVRAVSVATGGTSAEELLAEKPDLPLPALAAEDSVFKSLTQW